MNQLALIRKIDSFLAPIYVSCPWTYYGIITRAIGKNGRKLLDVGCGDGSLAKALNLNKNFKLTGVDIFEPYLKKARKTGLYEKLIKADVRNLPFKEEKFDVVFCAHLIEHLTRKEGFKLIKRLESLARKKVVIASPVGFLPQDEYNGNPFQKHKSVWWSEDFKTRGYKVVGQGLRLIYGQQNVVERLGLLSYLFSLVSLAYQPLLFLNPNLGVYIICWKEMGVPSDMDGRVL